MPVRVLDSFALIAYFRDEPGAEMMETLLVSAGRKDQPVLMTDVNYAAIYDSFTITLTILLEEIGLSPRGAAGRQAREGRFNHDGKMPLNTHGGLLSYGHCGVGGAMAHLVETHRQLTNRAQNRQAKNASMAYSAK